MPNPRIPRVNELLKKEVGGILLREVGLPGVLITITRVETSPALLDAKVYFSVMPEDRTGEVAKILKKEVYGIQQKINKRLKMRPVPKIRFTEERLTKEAGKIEKILEEIKKDEGPVE